MSMQQFAQQIEHLLWTGAIEGEEIPKLYHSLKAYEQGLLTAEIMQEAIDQSAFLKKGLTGGQKYTSETRIG